MLACGVRGGCVRLHAASLKDRPLGESGRFVQGPGRHTNLFSTLATKQTAATSCAGPSSPPRPLKRVICCPQFIYRPAPRRASCLSSSSRQRQPRAAAPRWRRSSTRCARCCMTRSVLLGAVLLVRRALMCGVPAPPSCKCLPCPAPRRPRLHPAARCHLHWLEYENAIGPLAQTAAAGAAGADRRTGHRCPVRASGHSAAGGESDRVWSGCCSRAGTRVGYYCSVPPRWCMLCASWWTSCGWR